jgi:Na+/proline symporter
MRTAIELVHVLIGLGVTWIVADLAAWSYPTGRHGVWWVAYGVMAVLVVLGIAPLRAAWRRDRNRTTPPDSAA